MSVEVRGGRSMGGNRPTWAWKGQEYDTGQRPWRSQGPGRGMIWGRGMGGDSSTGTRDMSVEGE